MNNTSARYAWSIRSTLAEEQQLCAQVKNLLIGQFRDEEQFRVELLLREFVTNAVVHGNKLDPSKKVFVRLDVDSSWVTLKIADEGGGFDWRNKNFSPPSAADVCGRGLAIGTLYSDSLHFNDCGNEVTLKISLGSASET